MQRQSPLKPNVLLLRNVPLLPRWNPDADANARHTNSKDGRRSTSSSSSASSNSSSSSSSSSSDGSDHRKRHSTRRHRKSRSKRHHRHRTSSSSGSSTDSPLISCVSTPARRIVKKIKRGEYANFDRLLPPTEDAVPGQAVAPKKSRKASKRQVCDLPSWLEAWNIFLAIRVQMAPKTALQLVKYQTIVCQLFSAYPAASALKYDRLFREAAARSKSTLQWDVLKEDILVWCVTRNPFRARQQVQSGSSTPRQGSATTAGNASNQQGDRSVLTTTGQEICRRTASALKEPNATMPTSAGVTVVVGTTLLQPALAPSRHPCELQRAHTPLRSSTFEQELRNHPDKAWTSWLLAGIDNGVSTGYNGPRFPHTARNLASARKHPDIIDTELAKEIAAGRILGPFSECPLTNLRTSGMGAVAKKNGKWRVIMHLSALEGSSINDFIDKGDFPIHYATVDDAVAMVSRYGKGCIMAKIDLKAAFRMVPIAAEEWDLLGLHWKGKYYIDTCLPFGLRSAPYLFNQFASALHWIMATNYAADVITIWMISSWPAQLDSPLVASQQKPCSEYVRGWVSQLPWTSWKAQRPPSHSLASPSTLQQLRLPPDKLQEMTILIKSWLGKHKATKRDLLSLIGKLSFAAKVVPSGHLFLRRLIELSTTVSKLHHHIHLNVEAREDIIWWDSFLPSWNGVSIFLDPNWKDAETINLFTDASGTLGYGAYFNGAWFHGDWSPHQRLPLRSIQWQELFVIVAAACTWGHLLQGQRITVHCDNMAIVQSWSNQSARHPGILHLLRTLFFVTAKHSFIVRLVHLPGKLNRIADALSRNQLSLFSALAPQANPQPTPVPPELAEL